MSSIEIEIKLVVRDEGDFQRLMGALPDPMGVREQLNLYLDTSGGMMAGIPAAFRLRISARKAWYTLKKRTGAPASAVFRSLEIEEETDRDSAVAWLSGVRGLEPPKGEDFGEIGALIAEDRLVVRDWSWTRRWEFAVRRDMKLLADESLFGDGTRDFELEIEHPDTDRAQRVALDVARRAGISLAPQVKTKHGRARDHRGDEPWPLPGEE